MTWDIHTHEEETEHCEYVVFKQRNHRRREILHHRFFILWATVLCVCVCVHHLLLSPNTGQVVKPSSLPSVPLVVFISLLALFLCLKHPDSFSLRPLEPSYFFQRCTSRSQSQRKKRVETSRYSQIYACVCVCVCVCVCARALSSETFG